MPKPNSAPTKAENSTLVDPARRSSIRPPPSTAIVGTDLERVGFEFYCLEIGQELSVALRLDLAQQLILQASHSNAAVKSAVVAIGLMGQRLRVSSVLTPENEEANSCHDLAEYQYCRALKGLREQMSQDSVRLRNLVAVTCLLFTVFEFLRGNDAGAVMHLRGGLAILRQEEVTAPRYEPLKNELRQTFSWVDFQATMWLGLRSFQSPALSTIDEHHNSPPTLHYFSTLGEASESLNFQITRFYRFRRRADVSGVLDSPDLLPPFVIARLDLVADLEGWPPAVSALLAKLARSLNGQESYHLAMMRMNYHIYIIMLNACLRDDEVEYYHQSESCFCQIVALARSILQAVHGGEKMNIEDIAAMHSADFRPLTLFTFCAAVIQPLYLTAIKCRNLELCQEAINLLSSTPWREGAWDSATMARIARRKVQQLREEGYYSRQSTPRRHPFGMEEDQTWCEVSELRLSAQMRLERWVSTHEKGENTLSECRNLDSSDSKSVGSNSLDMKIDTRLSGSRSTHWDITQVFQM